MVTASPRGFGASGRLTAAAGYRVTDLASDLVAVMEAAGFERFSVFGYSFTGAFAPWLAHLTGRVDAVVSGGFPIAGDYSPLYPEIQALSAAAEANPAAWADLTSRFDNRAALAFYRKLSELPPDFLLDDLPCPLFAAQREGSACSSVPAGEREPVRWQGFRGTGVTPGTPGA